MHALRSFLGLALVAVIGMLASPVVTAAPLGFLMMRTYLPEGGPGKVVLPSLTFEYADGTSKEVPTCPSRFASLVELTATITDKQANCAWAMAYGAPERTSLNLAAPDTSAIYWVTPFMPDESLHRIVVRGQYPDARYLSFITYNSAFSLFPTAGVQPQLTDYEIVPDAGQANPWQQPAAAGGHYTVYIARNAADAPRNHLPMPPKQDGELLQILGSMPDIENCTIVCVPYSAFLRPSKELEGGMAPNDDSGYLVSFNKSMPGTVIVVRGKMPRVTQGSGAKPWLYSGKQLRYTSVCNYPVVKPYPVAACARDDELELDGEGYYTAVISGVLDKPASTAWRRDNWLRNSVLFPVRDHMVLIRHMVGQNFPQSALNAPRTNSPADTAAVMGEYYPATKRCTTLGYEVWGHRCKGI